MMKIVFVVGPCIARNNVCKRLLPIAGINLRCVNMYDHLRPPNLSEEELERRNIGLAVSDQFVIDRAERILKRNSKTLPINSVLVLNGFPFTELQADYLAATLKKGEHEVAVLHIEPQVYCRCHNTDSHKRYETFIRPTALRLAEDFRAFTLQYEEHANMRPFMLPTILRMFAKLKCKWNPSEGPQCLCEVTKLVEVPSKHELFKLIVKNPKILLECPHVSPLLIGA